MSAASRVVGFQKDANGTLQPPGTSKDVVRAVHAPQGKGRLAVSEPFLKQKVPKLVSYFAEGQEVDPAKVSPVLELIASDTWQGDLFWVASLTWSVRVSNGFGRRLRFLVRDDHAAN